MLLNCVARRRRHRSLSCRLISYTEWRSRNYHVKSLTQKDRGCSHRPPSSTTRWLDRDCNCTARHIICSWADLSCAGLGWYSRASSAEWSRALFSHGHHPAKPCPSSVVNCVLQRYNSNKTIILCSSTARIDTIKAAQVSHQISYFTPWQGGKLFAFTSNMVILDEAKHSPRVLIKNRNCLRKVVLINWS